MPSKGRYTAGKQVSRWEADSENIDIEYKNLEGQGQGHNCTCPLGNKKPFVIKVLSAFIVFGIGAMLGYLVRRNVDKNLYGVSGQLNQTKGSTLYGIKQDYDFQFSKVIQDDLEDYFNYEDHMKVITECVHMSGLGSANKLLEYVEKKWKTFPFDSVKVKRYNVTLSYPNYTNIDANVVTVHAANGELIFRSQYNTSSVHPEYLPFSAYSPSAKVSTTKVIYGHYGRKEDFLELTARNVSVRDALVILRYGFIQPGNKVRNAEERGAAGVILYSDPADYANNQTSVYPESWWLPGWAVQLSHVRYDLMGDPSTPDYSSITGVHHMTETKDHFPKIPVQPIRYDDARFLLQNMSGPIAKNEWFGGLGITYRLGPGYVDKLNVTLHVDNMIQERNISNILGVVKGHYESDKYVIIGSHIDSWIQGGVDSGTGYTVIQELARTFAYHINKGWTPRRTIIFALWDAAKYGNIGAYEWAQEYENQLIQGAVAYINLDAAIQGNYSFTTAADPLLTSLIIQATKSVQLNCSQIPWCNQKSSVYDQWIKYLSDKNNPDYPRFGAMGDGSDHGPFLYRLGIPTLFPRYTFNENLYPNLYTYPAFGALEDTKHYVETFIDPDYSLHISMAKILADVTLRLSDSAILPFDLEKLIEVMRAGNATMTSMDRKMQLAFGVKFDVIIKAREAIGRFMDIAYDLMEHIENIDKSKLSEFDLYLLNNKLVQVSRAFIADVSLPGTKHYRNILYGPDPWDFKKDSIFPGIIWSVHSNFNVEDMRRHLNEQISLIVLALNKLSFKIRSNMSVASYATVLPWLRNLVTWSN